MNQSGVTINLRGKGANDQERGELRLSGEKQVLWWK